jgi:hypothetical protein
MQGTPRSGLYEGRGGRRMREFLEDYGREFRRKVADDEVILSPQSRSAGGQSGFRAIQVQGSPTTGCEGGSSETSAAPTMTGSKSRISSRSPAIMDSGDHRAIMGIPDCAKDSRNKGDCVGGQLTIPIMEGAFQRGRQIDERPIEKERFAQAVGGKFSTPKKGKNIYVGQWDTIKAKMVWEAVDKNMHDMTRTQNGGWTCQLQGLDAFSPCRQAPLEGNFSKDTADGGLVADPVFTFSAPSQGMGLDTMPNAPIKKRKTKIVRASEGTGENKSHRLGKRKPEGRGGGFFTRVGKRNRREDNEVEFQDDALAVAGEQPRRSQ